LPFIIIIFGILEFYSLGPNIVESVLHRTGNTALNLMMITLSLPIVARIRSLQLILLFRRMLGLYIFFYAAIHMMVYIFIDRNLSILNITDDFMGRPYIIAGMVAFLSLVPLAVTSTKKSQIKLGLVWKKIHRLIYFSALSVLIHFIWQMKLDVSIPMLYLIGFIVIVLIKFYKKEISTS
jgi:sulfoxide reductase heme-binding subunit YedZ